MVKDFIKKSLDDESNLIVRQLPYQWKKKDQYFQYFTWMFSFDQIPYCQGFDVVVDFQKQEGGAVSILQDLVREWKAIVVDPTTFCRMVFELYGAKAALDTLTLVSYKRIDLKWRRF